MSLPTRLLGLVLTALIPLLVLAVSMQLVRYSDDVEQVQLRALDISRALHQAVDHGLSGNFLALEALAVSSDLQRGNLAGFRHEVDEFLQGMAAGRSVTLLDPGGQQLLNTQRPPGAELPQIPLTGHLLPLFADGKSFITEIHVGPVTRAPQIALGVGVSIRGTRHALIMVLSAAGFRSLLSTQKIPPGWVASILDAQGNHVARQPGHDAYVMRPPAPTLQAMMQQGNEGHGATITLEGTPAFTSYSRSEVTGWTAALAAPRAVVVDRINESLVLTILGWFVTAVGAFALAQWVARSVTQPINSLAGMATAFGQGNHMEAVDTGMPEVDRVARALWESGKAQLETRHRLELAVLAAGIGVFDRSLDREIWSEQQERLFGLAPGAFGGCVAEWRRQVLPEDLSALDDQLAQCVARKQAHWQFRYRIRTTSGLLRHFDSAARLFYAEDGTVYRMVGVTLDRTEEVASDQRRQLLAREVDHRAKNALTVVLSLVRLTMAKEPNELVAAVERRVAALARAHTLLAESKWTGADLENIIHGEMKEYAEGRYRVAGPRIDVCPDAVQPLAMILHELAINTMKYGALVAVTGQVHLEWELDASGVALRWRETGGPPLPGPPDQRGFGSTLIETAVLQLGGNLGIRWECTGLQVDIHVPNSQLAEPPI